MTYKEMTKKYEERGLTDYQLRTLEDLKEIHGVDVRELSGYSALSAANSNLIDVTVLRFYNAHDLNSRLELTPKAVNYVAETEYDMKIGENEAETIGIVIDSINHNGKKSRLHRYVFNKNIPFSECIKIVTKYLCFELKEVWFHITAKGEWY